MSIMSILVASGAKGRVSLSYTFSASTANASLNVTSLSGYSAGKSDITVTVNSGVYLWATAITAPGLSLTGGTTGDTITLVNNGFIMGKGGNGLVGTGQTTRIEAQNGGSAISTSLPITINNTAGYIGGGGGGGGGYWYNVSSSDWGSAGGGGGAGGGTGGNFINQVGGGVGGGGGAIGQSGAASTAKASDGSALAAGGGGGRILPGAATTRTLVGQSDVAQMLGGLGGTAGGTGGVADYKTGSGSTYTSVGGSPNQAGSASTTNPAPDVLSFAVGGGGGWGASGGQTVNVSAATETTPGAGGKAVALNGNTITWTGGSASSSRAYGAVL